MKKLELFMFCAVCFQDAMVSLSLLFDEMRNDLQQSHMIEAEAVV